MKVLILCHQVFLLGETYPGALKVFTLFDLCIIKCLHILFLVSYFHKACVCVQGGSKDQTEDEFQVALFRGSPLVSLGLGVICWLALNQRVLVRSVSHPQ